MYKRRNSLSNAFLLVAVGLTMMMGASTSRAAGTVFDDRIDWEALLSLGELDGTAVLTGSSVSFTNSGTVVLRAFQEGDDNWNASPTSHP